MEIKVFFRAAVFAHEHSHSILHYLCMENSANKFDYVLTFTILVKDKSMALFIFEGSLDTM